MKLISNSEVDTISYGRALGHTITQPILIALIGEFGAGKTVFVKGLAAGLGVKKAAKTVTSPSFVLLHMYRGKKTLFHFDFYRLTHAITSAHDIGYEDFLDRGIVVVEWADKIRELLPDEHLAVTITSRGTHERALCFTARGTYPKTLLTRLQGKIS